MQTAETRFTGIGISWASVVAGAVSSLAITLVLLWFGIGMGFSVVSPWSGSGISAGTFKIGTGLYLIVIAMISSAIGGHIAGRLRSGWEAAHPNEVFFRDTANGFAAWALATVAGAILLASAASAVVGGAVGGLGQTVGAAAARSAGPMDGYVDQLLRTDVTSQTPAGDTNEARGELTRLFASGFSSGGELKPADRTYVAQVVARRTGLSQPDAEKRVNDVITDVKTSLDKARKAAAQFAFWMVASLLIGAFSASIAAAEAGGIRDRNWAADRAAPQFVAPAASR
jgi:hypothetical protein